MKSQMGCMSAIADATYRYGSGSRAANTYSGLLTCSPPLPPIQKPFQVQGRYGAASHPCVSSHYMCSCACFLSILGGDRRNMGWAPIYVPKTLPQCIRTHATPLFLRKIVLLFKLLCMYWFGRYGQHLSKVLAHILQVFEAMLQASRNMVHQRQTCHINGRYSYNQQQSILVVSTDCPIS